MRNLVKHCDVVQRYVLLAAVDKAVHSSFGRSHSFNAIRSITEFQQLVPLQSEISYRRYHKTRLCPVPVNDILASVVLADGMLNIADHFFEFMALRDARNGYGKVKLAHQLQKRKRYIGFVTNKHDIYRHRLEGNFRILGKTGMAPRVVWNR